MVGIGRRFPLCMQHQVANLSGTLDGSPPVDVGAVVNGPNGKDNFEGGLGGFQDGMAPLHRRVARGSTVSTATAAGTSTTSAPGRPTSRPST